MPASLRILREFHLADARATNRNPSRKCLRRSIASELSGAGPFIEFADDNAFVNRRYWKQLLPELKKRKIRWFAETDLSVQEDVELLRLMRASGCAEVLIGFESPGESGLRGLELKRDWKLKRWRESSETVRRIQSFGIRVNGCFILGLDGQGPEIFDEVLEFAIGDGAVRRPDHGSDPVPRNAALFTSETRGAIVRDERLGDVYALRRQFPPATDVARGTETRISSIWVCELYSHELTERRRASFEKTYRTAAEQWQDLNA